MSKIFVFGVLAALLAAGVISSASSGLISQIPEMSRKAQLALVGLVCLAGWAAWFYFQGGFDYLMWRQAVPPVPQSKRASCARARRGGPLGGRTGGRRRGVPARLGGDRGAGRLRNRLVRHCL